MPPRAKAAAAGGGGAQGSGSAPVVTNEAALAQQNAWHAGAKADVLKTVGYGFDVNVVRQAQKVKTYEYVASLKEYDHAVKTGLRGCPFFFVSVWCGAGTCGSDDDDDDKHERAQPDPAAASECGP
eukprot:g13694.t1